MNLYKTMISLNDKQKQLVSTEILDAAIVRELSGDYRKPLVKARNKSIGRIRKMYDEVLMLSDEQFGVIVDEVVGLGV